MVLFELRAVDGCAEELTFFRKAIRVVVPTGPHARGHRIASKRTLFLHNDSEIDVAMQLTIGITPAWEGERADMAVTIEFDRSLDVLSECTQSDPNVVSIQGGPLDAIPVDLGST